MWFTETGQTISMAGHIHGCLDYCYSARALRATTLLPSLSRTHPTTLPHTGPFFCLKGSHEQWLCLFRWNTNATYLCELSLCLFRLKTNTACPCEERLCLFILNTNMSVWRAIVFIHTEHQHVCVKSDCVYSYWTPTCLCEEWLCLFSK